MAVCVHCDVVVVGVLRLAISQSSTKRMTFAFEQRRVSLVGDLDDFHLLTPRPHRRHGLCRKYVGIAAADHQHRHTCKRVVFVPERGDRAFNVDAGERAGQADIVGRHQRAVFHLPGPPRGGEPLLRGQIGKLRAHDAAQDVGAILEAARLRQLTEIAFDARQALRLNDRTDVVQHDAGDSGRMRRAEQHGQNAAPRAAEENGRADGKRCQHADDVAEFDDEIVVLRIAVVLGSAAAARINGDDAAPGRTGRQRRRQFREIGHRAGDAGETNDRQAGRAARTIFAHMQPQSVLRAHKYARACFAGTAIWFRQQMRGGFVHRFVQGAATISPRRGAGRGKNDADF